MNKNNRISADISVFLEQLDKEQEQEARNSSGHILSIDEINPEVFRERQREYRDVEKHWVRKNAWLKVAQQILKSKTTVSPGTQGLRYLTLPSYFRLDVSLLMSHNLLEITKQNDSGIPEQIYVAGFETDPFKFGRMQGQIPRLKLLGATTIENALTNPEDEYYIQLRELFPFDIVNLDLTTSLTPRHEGPYSKTLQAIETVFELQGARPQSIPWALFLTFRNVPNEWEQSALIQFLKNLQENLDIHPLALEAFQKRYQKNSVDELRERDERTCMSQSIVKWLVDRGNHYKFALDSLKGYYYTRHNAGLPSYDVYKVLLVFKKDQLNIAQIPTKVIPTQSWMIDGVVKCIGLHRCIDVEERLLSISYNGKEQIFSELELEIDTLCSMVS